MIHFAVRQLFSSSKHNLFGSIRHDTPPGSCKYRLVIIV